MVGYKQFAIRILCLAFCSVVTSIAYADIDFTSSTFSAQEDAGSITVSVDLLDTRFCPFGECYDIITIDYSVSGGGTATSGVDFTPVSGQLSWTGNGTQSFQIPLVADSNIEPDETITVTLNSCQQQTIDLNPIACTDISVSSVSATAIITNDDISTPGTISLSPLNNNVNEGQPATISVSRTGGSDGAVSIDFATFDSTALSDSDYIRKSGSLSWTDGESGSKTITLTTLTDLDNESNETFTLTLSNPTGGALLSALESAAITIQNVDTPGTISFDKNGFVIQEGGQVTATVTRSNGSYGAASVDFATANDSAVADEDYTATSGTLSWANGESGSKTILLTARSDFANEGNETFLLTLSNPSGEASLGVLDSATITIQNANTFGTISFDNDSFIIQEGGQVTATVTRSNGSYGAVSVDFTTANDSAVAGDDYTATSGTLSWADGESGGKTILLTTHSDFANESDETFLLTLSNPSGDALLGALDSAVVTIQNTDTPGTIGFDKNSFVIQEGGQVTVTVTRSRGSYGAVSIEFATINDSAVAGDDYTASSGTLNWADSEFGGKSITIGTLSDVAIEENESFIVSLSNLIGEAKLGTQSTTTISIVNTTQALNELQNLTPNQLALANALDEMCDGATDDLYQRCQEIYNSGLDNDQLKDVIDNIKPAQVAAQGSTAINFGFQQLQVIHGRIVNLRQNTGSVNRISLAGFSMNSFGQQIAVGQIAQALIYNALDQSSGDEPLRDSPLGFFVKGQIDLGEKNSTKTEKGFEVDTKSITVGLDYQLIDQLVLGIASGYGHSDTDIDNNGGELETHSGNFSTYGSYFFPQDFYINWILSYAINDYENSRNILYPSFQATATSNPFGDQYGGSLGFGKDFYVKHLFISPYVQIEYLGTSIDEYVERGGGGFALRIAEQSIFSLTSTVGGQINHAFSVPWGVISPGMRFEWRHQFRDDQRTIQSQFVDAPAGTGNFSIRTNDPDRDYFNLGASLAITLAEGRSAFLRYETRLGQNDMTNHTIEAAIRITF